MSVTKTTRKYLKQTDKTGTPALTPRLSEPGRRLECTGLAGRPCTLSRRILTSRATHINYITKVSASSLTPSEIKRGSICWFWGFQKEEGLYTQGAKPLCSTGWKTAIKRLLNFPVWFWQQTFHRTCPVIKRHTWQASWGPMMAGRGLGGLLESHSVSLLW